MIEYTISIILLLFLIIGLLLCVQSLVEWRRADLDDYERRFLNKHNKHNKNIYHNAEKEEKEHD